MNSINSQPISQLHADSITILECEENHKRAANVFHLDDDQFEYVTSYDAGAWFSVVERPLNDIDGLVGGSFTARVKSRPSRTASIERFLEDNRNTWAPMDLKLNQATSELVKLAL